MRVAGMSAKENRILDIAARNVNIVGWRFHALHGSPASTAASPARASWQRPKQAFRGISQPANFEGPARGSVSKCGTIGPGPARAILQKGPGG